MKNIKPTPILSKMTNEELLKSRDEFRKITLEAKRSFDEINLELFGRVSNEVDEILLIDGRKVSIVVRPIFSEVPIAFAKKYKATKVVINGEILSAIYESNKKEKDPKKRVEIPGLITTEYIHVAQKRKKE